jgi:hypothetical protein
LSIKVRICHRRCDDVLTLSQSSNPDLPTPRIQNQEKKNPGDVSKKQELRERRQIGFVTLNGICAVKAGTPLSGMVHGLSQHDTIFKLCYNTYLKEKASVQI